MFYFYGVAAERFQIMSQQQTVKLQVFKSWTKDYAVNYIVSYYYAGTMCARIRMCVRKGVYVQAEESEPRRETEKTVTAV